MNDVISLAMEQASESFGGSDKVFNGAGFAARMAKISRCKTILDGKMVRVILAGRPDVKPLPGGSHYQII